VAQSSLFDGTLFDRLAAWRLYARGKFRESVSVFDHLKDPRKVLIVPSDKPWGLLGAAPFIQSVRQAYPQADIRILVDEVRAHLAALIPFADEVISGPLNASLWSTKVKKLCSDLKSDQFDLVFCLGSDCSVRNAAVVGASGGRLLVGFSRQDFNFFNFELTGPHENKSERDEHRHMLSAINVPYESSWRWSVPLDIVREKGFPLPGEGSQRCLALDLADGAGQRWSNKQLDEILQHWLSNGFEPVILFSLAEDKKVRYLKKTHGQDLRMVDKRNGIDGAAFLQSCQGLVALNTDYLHLAIAFGIPIVTRPHAEAYRWVDPIDNDRCELVSDRGGTALAEALIRLQ
jgi:ADP-heptose:LPS heptosyltransferase